MEFLHNVTGTPGFSARSAVKCGEHHDKGDSGPCNAPGADPQTCGWVNSTACYRGVDDGSAPCCWVWKRDTSSDEVDGHVASFAVAHALLAETPAEKARLASTLCATVQYIVDGGLVYIDPLTGNRTTWGYWDPADLNGVPGKPGERGGNALEVLGYLGVASQVCESRVVSGSNPGSNSGSGSEQHIRVGGSFGALFTKLVTEDRYGSNILNVHDTSPSSIAFFDYRLAFTSCRGPPGVFKRP